MNTSKLFLKLSSSGKRRTQLTRLLSKKLSRPKTIVKELPPNSWRRDPAYNIEFNYGSSPTEESEESAKRLYHSYWGDKSKSSNTMCSKTLNLGIKIAMKSTKPLDDKVPAAAEALTLSTSLPIPKKNNEM